MTHRRGKAFLDWSPIEVADAFCEAADDRALVYSVDNNGVIDGVGHGRVHRKERVFYVCNVLTTRKEILNAMLTWFKMLYPGYRLQATRHDRIKRYDTVKLLQKLT
jgi:hypothetical protein